jgi:hypothetical protein
MYKNASYKEKFITLKDWIPLIVEIIKKDLKNEHLKKDLYFVKKFLSSKNIHKLSTEDLVDAYSRAIAEDESAEQIAEFMTSRWLLKNSEVYDFFAQRLSQINPEFTTIEELSTNDSQALIKDATEQFGAVNTYLFSVLNSVVFPESVFHAMHQKAKQEKVQKQAEEQQFTEKMSIENMQRAFEREIARLTDKYEKKLSGLQKKYQVDMESLKKQVASLQRKLQEKA